MTPLLRSALVPIAGLALAGALTGCGQSPAPVDQAQAAQPKGRRAQTPPPRPPQALQQRLEELGRGFDGRIGIAVRDIQSGWTAAYNGKDRLPQQSVAKLWVAIAVLDAVDRGQLNLSDPVLVRREDLSVFHQPLRAKIGDAGYNTTIGELLALALAESDNAANEVLSNKVGGPKGVEAMLKRKALGPIAFGPGEKTLQTGIAGLTWRPEYSFGMAFWNAREALPQEVRRKAMDAYLAHPPDGATPEAIVEALARLKRGELLRPETTEWLLTTMSMSKTGPKRLRAGLGPGWGLSHKTGTGQVLGAQATGFNDVGIMTAPDGRAYAVAVMIGSTRRSVPARMDFMSAVSRAVVDQHEGRAPAIPAP
ncbi:MAG TPA: serine hydrolase [Caulobacteraceae bacterium]|jgi:beta-lactamase class A